MISVAQLVIAFSLLRMIDYCCDAGFYLATGKLLLNDGLSAAYVYDGHRSYLAPMLIYGIQSLPFADWIGTVLTITDVQRYGVNAIVVFAVLTNLGLIRLIRQQALRVVIASALVWCNPILLAHIIVPLQESAMLMLFLPVFLLLCLDDFARYRLALAVLLSVYAYMVRESYAFVAVPLLALAIMPMLVTSSVREKAPQSKLAVCAALLIGIGLVAPQSIRNHRLYGFIVPYHSANIQSDQLLWGARMYRYSTEKAHSNWQGFQYQIPIEKRTVALTLPAAALAGEWRASAPVLTHMAVGLIHDSPGPYVTSSSAASKRWWAFLSTVVVALGGFGMILLLRNRATRVQGLASFTLLALSLLYTAFVSTETRFGILGFAALAIASIGYFDAAISLRKKLLMALTVLPVYWLVLQWLAWLDATRQLL